MPHTDYRVGVNSKGNWVEVFNSDEKRFWGTGMSNSGPVTAEKVEWHGREQSVKITVPPLAAVIFKQEKIVPAKYELK